MLGSTLLPVAVISTVTKNDVGRQGLQPIIERRQARHQEAETEEETLWQCRLLTCSPWLALLASYSSQEHLPMDGIASVSRILRCQSLTSECPTDMTTC